MPVAREIVAPRNDRLNVSRNFNLPHSPPEILHRPALHPRILHDLRDALFQRLPGQAVTRLGPLPLLVSAYLFRLDVLAGRRSYVAALHAYAAEVHRRRWSFGIMRFLQDMLLALPPSGQATLVRTVSLPVVPECPRLLRVEMSGAKDRGAIADADLLVVDRAAEAERRQVGAEIAGAEL